MDFTTLVIIVFVMGYLGIVLEHPLKINKTASALLTGVLCWSIYAIAEHQAEEVNEKLAEHLSEIAQILFFLLGAMTIVELVDAHQGFRLITDRIKTRYPVVLLWIIAVVTFFLSAILDNLTTSIVMVSLLRKLLSDLHQRRIFAAIVIIAANSGGAWSPIGDVTTTMLWIGGQISTLHIMKVGFIPSLVSTLVPLIYFSFRIRGNLPSPPTPAPIENALHSRIMLFMGVGALVFVPIFKTITHLPPYMGILLGLAVVWMISELLNSDKDEAEKENLSVAHALSKVDTSSILFFLGILVAVSALSSVGVLIKLAQGMNTYFGNLNIIVIGIGLASAVIDNVPLVAAAMQMYDLTTYPMDHHLWAFMAYCAGTGGSILIIGSAAGVAVMGMEKVEFFWYFRHISLITLLGYLAGAGVYLLLA